MYSLPNNSISVLAPVIKRFVITRGGGIPRVWMYKVTRIVVEPRILSYRYSGSQKSKRTALIQTYFEKRMV